MSQATLESIIGGPPGPDTAWTPETLSALEIYLGPRGYKAFFTAHRREICNYQAAIRGGAVPVNANTREVMRLRALHRAKASG